MTGIVLSASVRQNLLSLQSTASLLATTQNDLSTGNKVNTALDNPTSYFTASALNNRASDIGNLLDSIGNGVQVLQAANTGITSLQSLVASAQSIANQVLQTPIGYSAKSSVTTTSITGATATNLLGTGAADATFTGAAEVDNQSLVGNGVGTVVGASQVTGANATFTGTTVTNDVQGSTAVQLGTAVTNDAKANTALALGSVLNNDNTSGTAVNVSANTSLVGTPGVGSDDLGTSITDGSVLHVNGKTITFSTTAAAGVSTVAGGNLTIGLVAGSKVSDVLSAIDQLSGNTGAGSTASTISGGQIQLNTGTASDLTITGGTGNALTALGLTAAVATPTARTAAPVDITGSTKLVGTASGTSDDLATAITNGSTITINNKTITFSTAATTDTTDASGNVTLGIGAGSTDTISTILSAIDTITGTSVASSVNSSGQIQLQTGTNSDLTLGGTGNVLGILGLSAVPATTARTAAPANITTATQLLGTPTGISNDLATPIQDGSTLTVDGKTITFSSTAPAGATAVAGGFTIGLAAGTKISDVLSAIDQITGATTPSTVTNGKIVLSTGTTQNLTITGGTGNALTALGLGTGVSQALANGAAATTPLITSASLLAGTPVGGGPSALTSALNGTDSLTVNGKTITFSTTAASGLSGSAAAGFTIGVGSGNSSTINDVLSAINQITGGSSSVNAAGEIELTTNTATAIDLTGSTAGTLTKLGLSAFATTPVTIPGAPPAITAATALSGAVSPNSNALSSSFADGDTLTVNGKVVTFSSTNPTSTSANGGTISTAGTVQDVLDAIDKITGSTGANAASVSNGQITLHTGTASSLNITSSNAGALAALGFGTGVSQADSPLTNKTLTIAATGNGVPTNITFGTGPGQVSTLNELNIALAPNNLQATIDSTGAITVTTSNNAASTTIGKIGGTATPFSGLSALGPVADPNAQATRAGLITQYNNTLKQIDTTAQDSSFNGINLLAGDTLNLTFDETGKSTLAIQGVALNTAGLALAPLTAGTDFLDSNSANAVLASLSAASTTLRSEASNLGSNLSIVEIRQDFSKSLINVLQTGASNLTLADTNEEAANSQALSTRQSIAVSALALANQSQQSVLQLLR